MASLNVCKAQCPDDAHPYILHMYVKECWESLCSSLIYYCKFSESHLITVGTIPNVASTVSLSVAYLYLYQQIQLENTTEYLYAFPQVRYNFTILI